MPSASELKDQGNQKYSRKEYQEAINLYDEAIKLDSTFSIAHHNKGVCLLELGELNAALEAFDAALLHHSGYTKASFNKAKTLEKMGQFTAAWSLLKNVLQDKNLSQADRDLIARKKFELECEHQARLVFACVDLKLTESGEIKVLEFGGGVQSAATGLESISGKSIDYFLRQGVHKANLPPLFINHRPGIQLGTQSKLLHHYVSSIPEPSEGFNFSNLNAYELVSGGLETREGPDNVLLMDDVNLSFMFGDKALSDDVFKQLDLTAYRPKAISFSRKYSDSIAHKIRASIPGQYYVIKAPDVERGKGVAIVSDQDLEGVLKLLLLPQEKILTSGIKQSVLQKMKMFSDIRFSQSNRILVEEYITNKSIEYKQEIYDPTARVFFLYTRDAGQSSFLPLASYWKIPPHPISETGQTLHNRSVSSFSANRVDAKALDEADELRINQALSEIVPKVFDQAIKNDYFKHIQLIPEFTLGHFGASMQWLIYANHFALKGFSDLSMLCLNKIDSSHVPPWRIPHHRAIAQYAKGDVNEAIKLFDKVLELDITVKAAYGRLMRLYAEEGDEARFNGVYADFYAVSASAAQFQSDLLLRPSPIYIAGSSSSNDADPELSDKDQAEYYKQRGHEHFKAGRYEQAIVEYEKAIFKKPSAVYWHNKAKCHHQLGMLYFALGAYHEAIECDPHYFKPYCLLISLSYQMNKPEKADEFKQKALSLSFNEDEKRSVESLTAASVRRQDYPSIWERKCFYAQQSEAHSASESMGMRRASS